jgi:gamma-glutamyltranspeptidase/glutathione hydrolase
MDHMLYLTMLLGGCGLTVADESDSAAPARTGMVVSVSGPASDVGADILRRGGNAVDAAIATAFALAVTWPEAGNLGGGGYMLVHPATGEPTSFDFRETAPKAATREMFVVPKARTPHRRVGVPGTVAGLALAHRKRGKLPWNDLVAPALRLARDGFELDAACARSLNDVLKTSTGPEFAELRRVYGNPAKRDWKTGDRLVQPDLAKTLSRIAEHGPDGFYAGPVADLLVA